MVPQPAPFDCGARCADRDLERETSVLNSLSQRSQQGYVLVLDLWSADRAMSVLELNTDGVLSHTTAFPLYPPGAQRSLRPAYLPHPPRLACWSNIHLPST